MQNIIPLFPSSVKEEVFPLSTGHKDVTNDPIVYATPKKFVFITKDRLDWIASNRKARQMLKEQNITSVHDISSFDYSIDNLKTFKVKLFDDKWWAVIVSIIVSAFV